MFSLRSFRRDVAVALTITRINLRSRLDFRADFITGVALGAIWQMSIVVFAAVILVRFPYLGGWTSKEVLLIAAMRLTSHSLHTLFFGQTVYMGRLVQEGQIDTFLVRPMPVYRQVLLSRFQINAFGDLGVALTMLTVALVWGDVSWTPGRVALLIVGIIGGMFTEAAIYLVMSCWTLKNPAASSWSQLGDSLLTSLGNYPLNILSPVVRIAFTYVFPLAFIAYLPVATITGQLDRTGTPAWLGACAPVVGLVLYLLARRYWIASLRGYQGANG